MTDNTMKYMKIRLLIIGLMLISNTFVSYGQTRQEKTVVVINKMGLLETQKMIYQFQFEALKYQATGNDSAKIVQLEKQLTEEEIVKKISTALNETFSDEEMNVLYEFVQTSAFKKSFVSGESNKAITSQFKDIDKEIEGITKKINETIEKTRKIFNPIPVDKENGFYLATNYSSSIEDKDIKLEDNPSMTFKDILEVKKVYESNGDNRAEILITLTKEGARKFYLLTKNNIGNLIAIVVEKQIVTMPIVQSEILGGKLSISGNFSEDEIDQIIQKLKENNKQ
jgi:preprotein translocase subunit SecD